VFCSLSVVAKWAQRQREEFRRFKEGAKSTLNKSRIRKLDDMGFDWDCDNKVDNGPVRRKEKDSALFNMRIAQLAEINDKYGDCNDINNLRAAGHPPDSQLYQWMKRQRKGWKSLHAGEWSWLDQERIALLESVKFNFEPYKHRLPYGSKKGSVAATGGDKSIPDINNEESSEDDEDDNDENASDHPVIY
jgi:Helicase associated domain